MRGLLQHWTESSIIPTSKEESVWRNKRHPKRTVSFAEDRLLTWSTSTSGSLEPTILSRIMPTYSKSVFEMTIFRNLIQSATKFYCPWRKSHLIYHRRETMVRRSVEQDIRNKNFGSQKRKLWEERRCQESGEQKSVNKEVLEIVGNIKLTGSVWKETVAVSVTMLNNRGQSDTSRIRLRILSCGRMSENHREPEVREEQVPSGRMSRWPCKDYLKRTCTNSFCEKWHLQNACSTRPRVVSCLVKSARMHIVRLMNSPRNGPKRIDDKSAGSSYIEEEWLAWKRMATCCQPWQKSRKTVETRCQAWYLSWVETRTCWTPNIKRTIIGLCLSRHEAAEVDLNLTEELRHAETNPTCQIHGSYCTSHWNSRPKSFVGVHLPRWTSSAQPQRPNIWGSVSGGDRVARARCPRSSVEAGHKCVQN